MVRAVDMGSIDDFISTESAVDYTVGACPFRRTTVRRCEPNSTSPGHPLRIVDDAVSPKLRCDFIDLVLAFGVGLINDLRLQQISIIPGIPHPYDVWKIP